ncbi:unnamed protein product [Ilex paraguariensis]|uniref:Uncharacterized protein n=1 Tax=Ilex paraguariensis TaxID=185542 RepID=A0ABC8T7D3_9AQUA
MEIIFALLLGLSLGIVINAQGDQSEGGDYTDGKTGIIYTSDTGFVDTGASRSILPTYMTSSIEQQFKTVRSFPEGTRNCYTLRPAQGKGNKYLIRASFLYGNYDSQNILPRFDLHVGVDTWDTVILTDSSTPLRKEIIHIPTSDYISICLVKTGRYATPFISSLELRLMNNTIYETLSGSLNLISRVFFDSSATQLVRYKDDVYDRIWRPFSLSDAVTLNTSNTFLPNIFQPPSIVIRSAASPGNSADSLSCYWGTDNATDQFYAYMHFGEVQSLKANQSRAFDIYINGDFWYGPVVPGPLVTNTIYSTKPKTGYLKYDISLNKTSNSTLPPIINAAEVYSVKNFSSPETYEEDVDAMLSIKSMYNITRNWQGDPCAPTAFVWDGLNCSYNAGNPPRIISLDLSNNSLTGEVPDFLSQLTALKVLNLKGNNFNGSIPAQILEKSKNGTLSLRYYSSNRLTDKSDVYSFGVVLLEIITGQPAIIKTHEQAHIVQWVSSILEKGDVKNIVDPRLGGGFYVNSAWKAVELAMACVSRSSNKRPTMTSVVKELKECLDIETADNERESKDSIGVIPTNMESGLGPRAR